MEVEQDRWSRDLARLRPLLSVLARQNLNPRLWKDIDPSGVVQETLIEAHQSREQFLGLGAPALESWVRRILLHNLYDALRKIRREKRDVGREVSIAAALEESTSRVKWQLSGGEATPSQIIMRKEEVLHLAAALEQIESPQRDVIELHHLQGRSLAETAAILGRSQSAVAALLHRGLQKLKERLKGR
jgi:RNA polymerase sigma-70 factor (ECF subfamily)